MDQIVGQLMLWAGTFAPKDWAPCEGQLLPIRSYTALFSILGTTYGGDGKVTFALPDLRGRGVCHDGGAPGLQPVGLGDVFGTESYGLTTAQMPVHTHSIAGTVKIGCNSGDKEDSESPQDGFYRKVDSLFYAGSGSQDMGPSTVTFTEVGAAGGNKQVSNFQPALGLTYCIALTGIFPQRP